MRAFAVLLLVGCSRTHEQPPPPEDPDAWHEQDVPECKSSLDLPGPVERSDGTRSVVYRTAPSAAHHDMYMVACMVRTPSDRGLTAAQIVDAQIANHVSEAEMGGSDFPPIVDHGVHAERDGGRWWIAYRDGLRVEGFVHVGDADVVDVSGSMEPNVPRAREDLDRVLRSYRRR
jgi:hypothetical protein